MLRTTLSKCCLPRSALLFAALIAAPALFPAWAQDPPKPAMIEFVAKTSAPPAPAGLQLVCMSASNSGAPSSDSCPVVKYQGISTWAFSYADNRNALAMVSVDANNAIVRNVEKPGARYLFDAMSNTPNQTVIFVGQAQQTVSVPWKELGTP